MELRINPFNTGNPMTLRDAAVVATIAALCIWILNFFASAEWVIIIADPPAWIFVAIKTYLVSWAGTFVTLAGLEQLVSRGKERE